MEGLDNKGQGSDQDYSDLLLIEDLESLLEDIEDSGEESFANLSPDLADRAQEAGVAGLGELRALIARLHSDLDNGEE